MTDLDEYQKNNITPRYYMTRSATPRARAAGRYLPIALMVSLSAMLLSPDSRAISNPAPQAQLKPFIVTEDQIEIIMEALKETIDETLNLN